MHEIEEYLKKFGFKENQNGFLTANIEGVTYQLLHNPLTGYALHHQYINKKSAAINTYNLGLNPTIEDLENAFMKTV